MRLVDPNQNRLLGSNLSGIGQGNRTRRPHVNVPVGELSDWLQVSKHNKYQLSHHTPPRGLCKRVSKWTGVGSVRSRPKLRRLNREQEKHVLRRIMAAEKYNRMNTAVNRILQETKEMQSNASDDFMSLPLQVTIPNPGPER
ncbi:hypothetical protein BHE74_00040260 [Ensete ventricosum]|nr:hypothetical protein BHE74_00040260 [Ensete ventricosum]